MLHMTDNHGAELELPSDGTIDVEKTVWYDLFNPTPEEETAVEAAVNTAIPTRDELHDIEPSSRLYTENGALYLTASLACNTDAPHTELADIGFIIAGGRLVTIRYANPRAFDIFSASIRRTRDGNGPHDILTRLLETIIDRTAEILEQTSQATDTLSQKIFRRKKRARPERTTRNLEAKLIEIARTQRLLSKTRESLMSLSRMAGYLQIQPEIKDDPVLAERCRAISFDIKSLSEHAGFIASNVTFLLDASLGLITVEQNTIIKIFSIAAVVLLPPTFVATIYGMNFTHMPELEWAWGYPASMIAMAAAGIVPYLWFRRKGWM